MIPKAFSFSNESHMLVHTGTLCNYDRRLEFYSKTKGETK